jgi:hypothetical protein
MKHYKDVPVPNLPLVPSLTTLDEQQYLYSLARDSYKGVGALIEIGTWFGCSAGYLAAGLRDAKKDNSLICFDRFSLSSSERVRIKEQGFYFPNLSVNGDTRSLVQKHLDTIYPNAVLKKQSIDEIVWDNGPIEIVHLDAPKRMSDIVHILKVFGPYLIPNTSLIVVQDFCVPRAYALPLIFGALGKSFELVEVPSSSSTTVTFKYINPYVINDSLDLNNWQSFSALEITRSFFKQVTKEQQRLLMIGLAFFCYDNDDKEMAHEILTSL